MFVFINILNLSLIGLICSSNKRRRQSLPAWADMYSPLFFLLSTMSFALPLNLEYNPSPRRSSLNFLNKKLFMSFSFIIDSGLYCVKAKNPLRMFSAIDTRINILSVASQADSWTGPSSPESCCMLQTSLKS